MGTDAPGTSRLVSKRAEDADSSFELTISKGPIDSGSKGLLFSRRHQLRTSTSGYYTQDRMSVWATAMGRLMGGEDKDAVLADLKRRFEENETIPTVGIYKGRSYTCMPNKTAHKELNKLTPSAGPQ